MPHQFAKGDRVSVENSRSEILYRGRVAEVTPQAVRVKLYGQKVPFLFPLDAITVSADGKTLFAAW